jgi:hypothetical protein
MFTGNEKIIPIPELPLTLTEVLFFLDLIKDRYDQWPSDYAKELGTGLMALYSYWSKRTRDPSRFVLHIKR